MQLVDAVIRSRKTVRAFTADARPAAEVCRHPSRRALRAEQLQHPALAVHVLEGEPKRRLSEALMQAHERNELPPSPHFPTPARRVRVAAGRLRRPLLRRAGNRSQGPAARDRQSGRNLLLLRAPVGLLFTIDSRLTEHSWPTTGCSCRR